MRDAVVGGVECIIKIDDSMRGRIETGNLRRTLLRLFRLVGPTTDPGFDIGNELAQEDALVVGTLTFQLSSEESTATLAALK